MILHRIRMRMCHNDAENNLEKISEACPEKIVFENIRSLLDLFLMFGLVMAKLRFITKMTVPHTKISQIQR